MSAGGETATDRYALRPLFFFFCFSLNNIWIQGFGPKKKRSRAQCIGWIHRNSRKRDRKKNTLSTERNWYLEVGPNDHLFLWPRWQRIRLTIGRSRVRAPPGALFFSFLKHFFRFFSKVLGILLRFSYASAWVGHIETRTQAIIYTGTKGCLLFTSPSPRDLSTSRMPSSA